MLAHFTARITPFGKDRLVRLWLPDGAMEGSDAYPVVYMFDGHNVFFDEDATYGIRVKNLITTYGDLKVIYDPLLEGSYKGYGFVLDPENIRYAYLDGRDTKLYTDIQDNDIDGVIDEYLTECSLELRLPQTHMMITGCYIPSE